jgi:hypothetical protein
MAVLSFAAGRAGAAELYALRAPGCSQHSIVQTKRLGKSNEKIENRKKNPLPLKTLICKRISEY